jgi:hypothetical protein
MGNEEYLRLLEQWLKQLQDGSPSPALTQSAATQFTMLADTGLRHLAVELESETDDPEVEEWLQACLADTIPIAIASPKIDLSFLTTQNWSADAVREAVEQGKQWVRDQIDAVYILFGQLLQGKQDVAWAVRSAETDKPIFHHIVHDENLAWQIEISAFGEDEENCRVEVAIFQPAEPDATLDNVPILLRIGDEPVQTLTTDIGGVVEFTGIPRARLDQVVVRIATRG